MEEDIALKLAKLLSEIVLQKGKLVELEREVSIQVEEMGKRGLTLAMLAPRVGLAIQAIGPGVREEQAAAPVGNNKRCKWWNRGFCREKGSCLFSHTQGDCKDHLDSKCKSQSCKLRHRKPCKYWATKEGCYRGSKCEYLHRVEPKVNNIETKSKEAQKESKVENKDFDVQTESLEEESLKLKYSNETESLFERKRKANHTEKELPDEDEDCTEDTNLIEFLEGGGLW